MLTGKKRNNKREKGQQGQTISRIFNNVDYRTFFLNTQASVNACQ